MIEEELPTKEYFRIRRADMRYIGRRLWLAMERALVCGGRGGGDWKALKEALTLALTSIGEGGND